MISINKKKFLAYLIVVSFITYELSIYLLTRRISSSSTNLINFYGSGGSVSEDFLWNLEAKLKFIYENVEHRVDYLTYSLNQEIHVRSVSDHHLISDIFRLIHELRIRP